MMKLMLYSCRYLPIIAVLFAFTSCEKLNTEEEHSPVNAPTETQDSDVKEDDDTPSSSPSEPQDSPEKDEDDPNTPPADGFYHGYATIESYMKYYGSDSTPVPYEDLLNGGCLYYELIQNDVYASFNDFYVRGYIIGYISSTSISSAQFTASNAIETNILLSENPNEQDSQRCIPVQLTKSSTSSTNTRNLLNLKSHPENLGKEVLLAGNIAKYMGVVGIKNASTFKFTH